MFGGYDAGSAFVRVGALFDREGFDKFDHAVEKSRREKAVKAELGGDYNKVGFDAYEKALDRAHARVKRRDAFKAALGGDYDPRAFQAHERAIARAERENERMVRSNTRVRTAFGSIWSRGGAAFAAAGGAYGLWQAVKSVTGAYGESEVSATKMRTQLRALGIDYDRHAKQIDRVIQKHSQLAGLDDEDLQDAFTAIVRTTGDVTKALNLTGLAADLARAKHLDVAKAGDIVAKVAGGNTGILSRYGITIKKGATATEALGLLQHKFAGQAEAYGKTQKGSIDRLQVAWENLREEIGRKLAPALTSAANDAATFVNQMVSGTGAGGRFVSTLRDIWNAIAPVLAAFKDAVVAVAHFAGAHPELTKVAGAIVGIGIALKALKFASSISGVSHLLGLFRRLGQTKAGQAAGEAIAAGLSDKLGGARSLIGRFRDFIANRLGIGGARGGKRAAENAAANLADDIGPNLNRKEGRIRSVFNRIFRRSGANAGSTAADVAAGSMYAGTDDALKKRQGRFTRMFGSWGSLFGRAFAGAFVAWVWAQVQNKIEEKLQGNFGATNQQRRENPANPFSRTPGYQDPGEKGADWLRNLLGLNQGGPVGRRSGYGGGDKVTVRAEEGEHVLTKEEVRAMGGHGAVERFRRGLHTVARLGPVLRPSGGRHQVGGPVGAGKGTASFTATVDVAGVAGGAKAFGDLHRLSAKELLGLTHDADVHGKKTRKNVKDNTERARDDGVKAIKDLHDKSGRELKDLATDANKHGRKLADNVSDRLDDARQAAKKKVTQLGRTVTGELDDTNTRSGRLLRRFARTVDARLEDAHRSAVTKSRQLAGAIGGGMDSADSATYTGMGYVARATAQVLRALGAKAPAFDVPRPSSHARGGIPNPGSGGRDDHLLLDPAGRPVAALSGTEGILNSPQMAEVDRWGQIVHALGLTPYGGLGPLWQSGMTHHAGGGQLARYADGGGLGTLLTRANQLDRMHLPYVWGGHHGDTHPIRNPRPGLDCSSAVSYVLGIPPRVSGEFEHFGKPGRGPVSILANSGHVYMVIAGRAFGTAHENPHGGAGWIDGYTYRSGFTVRHVDGAFGDLDVKRPVVRGPKGRLRATAQRAIDRTRAAGRRKVDKAAASFDNPNGQPLREGLGVGNYSGPLDRIFPAHSLAGAKGHVQLSSGQVVDLAQAATFGRDSIHMDEIAHGESQRYPGIISFDGGIGIEQITPRVQGGRILRLIKKLGGNAGMRNPWRNMVVAKALYDDAKAHGNRFGPWFGTQFLTAARGGLLRRFNGGGSLATAGPTSYAPAAGGPRFEYGYAQGSTRQSGSERGAAARWSQGIATIEQRVERLGTRYSNLSARFDLTDDSELVIEGDAEKGTPPKLNERKWSRRVGELGQLLKVQREIAGLYRREYTYSNNLIALYRGVRQRIAAGIHQVQRALHGLRGRKGKKADRQRTALEQRLKAYTNRLGGVRGKIGELDTTRYEAGQNAYSSRTDVLSLANELRALDPHHHGQALVDAAQPTGGSSGDGSATDSGQDTDLAAQFAQQQTIIEGLRATVRNYQGTMATFSGPGDIGTGAPNAYQAAWDNVPVGAGDVFRDQGLVTASRRPGPGDYITGAGGGGVGGLAPGMYVLKIDDPAGQRAIAKASNGGNSLAGYVPTSIERTGL